MSWPNNASVCPHSIVTACCGYMGPFYSVGFGEGLRLAKERLGEKNVYFTNPSFDR